jgi:hypothetical protein
MAQYDTGDNGIIFRVKEDGTVSVSQYLVSASYTMQTRIQPMIEKVAPKVRDYFENLLKAEMAKETRLV